MNRISIAILALLSPIAIWAQGVKIEFFTPSVVHVVKYQGQAVTPERRVVIAKPEPVTLTHRGSVTSSSKLSVKLDEKTGCITFMDTKGKVLLREKSHTFSPLNQTFSLDKGRTKRYAYYKSRSSTNGGQHLSALPSSWEELSSKVLPSSWEDSISQHSPPPERRGWGWRR